jgi:UPF0716 protein FxsA
MRIFLLMLPWLELFTLIQLGIHTSALTAMLYVLVTLILGIMILQRQGRGMFERLRQAQEGRVIGPELFLDDMAMGFAGLLLLIPGMISDFVALIVVIGPLRRRVVAALWGSSAVAARTDQTPRNPEIIEGDFRRLDDDQSQ